MNLTKDIKAFREKALLAMNDSVCKKFSTVASDVVNYSPHWPTSQFSQGLLINNWFPKVRGFSTEKTTVESDTGIGSLSRLKDMLALKPFYGKDSFVTFTNNVSYAYRAEYLGWPKGEGANGWVWSGRVGAYGMVTKAIIKFNAGG